MTTVSTDIKLEGELSFENDIDISGLNINNVDPAIVDTDAINKSQLDALTSTLLTEASEFLIDRIEINNQTTVVIDLGENYQDYTSIKIIGIDIISTIDGFLTLRFASGTASTYEVDVVPIRDSCTFYPSGGATVPSGTLAGNRTNGFFKLPQLTRSSGTFEASIYNSNKIDAKYIESKTIAQTTTNAYDNTGMYVDVSGNFQFNTAIGTNNLANNLILFDSTDGSFNPVQITSGVLLVYGYVDTLSGPIAISSVPNFNTDGNGNIGIGTTTYDEKLNVDGNVQTSGYIFPGKYGIVAVEGASATNLITTNSTSFITVWTINYTLKSTGNEISMYFTFNPEIQGFGSDVYYVAVSYLQYDANNNLIDDSGDTQANEIRYVNRSGGGGRAMLTHHHSIRGMLPNTTRVEIRLRGRKGSSGSDTFRIKNRTYVLYEYR